ncbi:hypothetical protein A1O3_05295 [Capronia epimyces CBS 606.96]|uniref:FAD dependent oxidoreductase domain-containing protein n=1 Tax=Capronia epimyces CBS 606.96 TaxID=1182542 RepID=W9Y4Q3_9EURO|nr:uncharacterized protein A1O3_05295 [Capronia epimyces CBS 606.96]EXJ84625.1 hypothetical protein A1O3_05295 [Capronia epimyces CBS 606.96]
MARQKHILVLGAGVIGLQTAISLLEVGYRVTILAEHLPGDDSVEYTSPWTGPHDFIPNGPASLWYAPHVRNFKVLPKSDLPSPFVSGAIHDGIAINTTPYLKSLVGRIRSLGGSIIRGELPTTGGLLHALDAAESILHSHQITKPVSLVVNATGLGACHLVPDSSVFPIRGQTVTVKIEAKHITTMFYPDANASITPRAGSGVSVLGSTYEIGNWDREPDPEVTKTILRRCKPLAPELLNKDGEFDVVSVNVAFRPGRKGGPRVEIEEMKSEDGQSKRVVCHAYGHAGGGFQNSFGSASKAVGLIDDWFSERDLKL